MRSNLRQKKLSDIKEKAGMVWRIVRRGELTPRKLLNLGKNRLAMLLNISSASGYPSLFMIEPTNRCNIACTFCDTGRGLTKRPKALMSFENYKKLIDEVADHVLFLFLYYIGEPFMHPRIYDMINYAHKKKISVYASTNGLLINTEEKAARLIESGLDTIFISFTGLDKETYEKYQPGGNFDKLINNIKLISQEKKRRKSKTPVIKLRFMVMKDNEEDVVRLNKIVAETSIDILNIRSFFVRNKNDSIKDLVPEDKEYSRYDIKSGRLEKKFHNKGKCEWIWLGGIVGVDGNALPCCTGFNEDYAMGDVINEGSFKAVWHGEKYKKMRRDIKNKKYEMPHCKDCSGRLGYQDFT
ncbi:MAG: radical SAM protein [Candidatus Mariimomonas ferrooxydans]